MRRTIAMALIIAALNLITATPIIAAPDLSQYSIQYKEGGQSSAVAPSALDTNAVTWIAIGTGVVVCIAALIIARITQKKMAQKAEEERAALNASKQAAELVSTQTVSENGKSHFTTIGEANIQDGDLSVKIVEISNLYKPYTNNNLIFMKVRIGNVSNSSIRARLNIKATATIGDRSYTAYDGDTKSYLSGKGLKYSESFTFEGNPITYINSGNTNQEHAPFLIGNMPFPLTIALTPATSEDFIIIFENVNQSSESSELMVDLVFDVLETNIGSNIPKSHELIGQLTPIIKTVDITQQLHEVITTGSNRFQIEKLPIDGSLKLTLINAGDRPISYLCIPMENGYPNLPMMTRIIVSANSTQTTMVKTTANSKTFLLAKCLSQYSYDPVEEYLCTEVYVINY